MKLKRFLLRYYPPGNNLRISCVRRSIINHRDKSHLNLLSFLFDNLGVILEYELRDKTRELKEIDLLHLTVE